MTAKPSVTPGWSLRPLEERDLEAATALLPETNFGPPPAELREDLHRSWSRWPSLQLVAAAADGALLGLVAGRVDRTDPLLGWSDDIVLHPGARGLQLGSRLITAQLDAFAQLGCTRVRGLSPQRLAHAISFFARHGFKVVEELIARDLWGIPDGEPLFVTECVLASRPGR